MKKLSIGDIFSLCVLFGSIFFFFLRLFWPTEQLIMTPDFGRSDIWHFSLSTKYLLWDALQTNHLPLWTSLFGNGFPIFAEGQTGVFFLPNLIIYKIFPFITAYNISLLFTLTTLAWGMYIWLRHHSFYWFVALFGALTLVFSGTVISQIPHITLLQSASLLPWILVSIEYLTRSPKSMYRICLFALLLQQQMMAGFPQMVFLTLLLGTGQIAWYIWQTKTKMLIFTYPIALLVGISLSAIQLVPSFEFLKQSTNPNGFSQNIATFFSYPPQHVLTFIDPFHFGNPKIGTYPSFTAFDGSIFWENVGFIGLVPLLLSILSIVLFLPKKSKKPTDLFFWMGTVIISLLFMFGKYSPFYIIYSFWPFSLFRVPSRFIWIMDIALIFLACFVLQSILHKLKKKRILLSFGLVVIVFHFYSITTLWYDYHPYIRASEWFSAPAALQAITPRDRIFSIGTESKHNEFFLKSGWTDMNAFAYLRNTLAPNSNVYWGIPNADVYAGRFLRRQSLFNDLLNDEISFLETTATVSSSGDKLLSILGVSKLISPKKVTGSSLELHTAQQSSTYGSLYIYNLSSNTHTPYFTNTIHIVTSLEEAKIQLQKDTFIPKKSALVEKEISLEFKEPSTNIEVNPLSDTDIQINVHNLETKSLLVNPITYYPGWVATVDKKAVEIIPVNITQQGIVIDPGTHEITWKYEPRSFKIGATLTGVLFGFIGLLMVFLRFFSPLRTPQATLSPGKHRHRNLLRPEPHTN